MIVSFTAELKVYSVACEIKAAAPGYSWAGLRLCAVFVIRVRNPVYYSIVLLLTW